MKKYTIIEEESTPICIKDNETGKMIPVDEKNREYKAYLQWVSEGNEPDLQEM